FEDVEFLQRARKVTRIYSFKSYVMTSARRFLKNGIIRQQMINVQLIFKYLRGATAEELAEEYRK
ncbi:MAG TPA: glycosyl transferase family 2, partial [Patescibacteria group bacterium]|nr:glycosyl transferase family 2 [Patescibacteria group bacterium]